MCPFVENSLNYTHSPATKSIKLIIAKILLLSTPLLFYLVIMCVALNVM